MDPAMEDTKQERARRHCDLAIVAEKYMVPDLVDMSAGNLAAALRCLGKDEEELWIMSRLFESITSSTSPVYVHMVEYWTEFHQALVQDHGKELLSEFIIANPDFAAHIVAEKIRQLGGSSEIAWDL
jgi:hypothetical protein